MSRLTSLGKYQLVKRIAVGGMSEIFLATQGGLDGFERAVVVKCIREDLDTENEVKDMFLDEARIAACLNHPNIVHLYDVGRDGEIAYLAMEYIFGRDLLVLASRARALHLDIPIRVIVKIMCDALAGLHYAHQVARYEEKPLAVIHRDVSPQNILVSFDGVTKMLDFGIAKASTRLSQTRAGVLKGKYAYMSPEQVRGKDLDHRSDQFSLAVVFYEILSGTRLFQRETDYSTMKAVDACDVPPLQMLRKDVPRRLARVLQKAMRKNPKKRFTSAKEMERSLHRMLKGSGLEQSEKVSVFIRLVFAADLTARDQAIREATDRERELILSTGFEMLNECDTQINSAPEAPLANQRFEQILLERQASSTKIQVQPLAGQSGGTAATAPQQAALAEETGEHRLPLKADWRSLVLLAAIVAVVGLFLLVTFSGPETLPVPGAQDEPRPVQSPARSGLDGFLSVSVSPNVAVEIDGQNLGPGAFRRHILERGIHKVKLINTRSGGSRMFTVRIKADTEFILSPAGYQ